MADFILCDATVDIERVLREYAKRHPDRPVKASVCRTAEQLTAALELTMRAPSSAQEQRFAIKTQEGVRIVPLREISYCRCESHRYVAVLEDGEEIMSRSFRRSFPKVLAPLLESGLFIQCQASYIVNLRGIKMAREKQLELHNGTKLPFPLSRQERLRKQLGFPARDD